MLRKKLQNIIFIIFISLIAASLLIYYLLAEEFSLIDIRLWLRSFGIWAPLVFILIYVAGTVFLPSTPFMALAGVLFGFQNGLIYTIIGGFISSLLVFSIARSLGKEKVDALLNNRHLKFLDKYNKRLGRGGILDLIVLRITPIMPFNVLNLIMGISKIKLRNYIFGTVVGLIPSNILTVYFGNILAKLF